MNFPALYTTTPGWHRAFVRFYSSIHSKVYIHGHLTLPAAFAAIFAAYPVPLFRRSLRRLSGSTL
jgi:hypothetical protein